KQNGSFFSLINEFAHPYTSLISSLYYLKETFDVRGVIDFYYGLISILPERLLGIESGESISYLNTFLIFHVQEGFYPPGLIGYFYYSLGVTGVILGSYYYTFLSNYFIIICRKHEQVHPIFNGLYIFFVISFCQYIMSGDPRVYIKSYFLFYMAFLIIIIPFKNVKIS